MNCPSTKRSGRLLLIEFAMGRARATDRLKLQAHAESCAACRSLIEEQRLLFAVLDNWDAGEPSFDFDRKLYARFEREEKGSWIRRLWQTAGQPLWIFGPSVPLAVVALLVTGFFAGDGSRWMTDLRALRFGESVPVSAPARAEDAAAQLDQAFDDVQMLDHYHFVKRRARRERLRPL